MYGSSTAATQTGHNFQGHPVLEKNAKNVHGMMVDIYFVTPQSLVYWRFNQGFKCTLI